MCCQGITDNMGPPPTENQIIHDKMTGKRIYYRDWGKPHVGTAAEHDNTGKNAGDMAYKPNPLLELFGCLVCLMLAGLLWQVPLILIFFLGIACLFWNAKRCPKKPECIF